MGEYQYKKPEGDRYKVSIRKWNKVFSNRGRWPFIVANVYLKSDCGVVHFNITAIGKLTLLMLSPFIYFAGTLVYGFPEVHRDFKRQLFDKRYGCFSSDQIYKGRSDEWSKINSLIKKPSN